MKDILSAPFLIEMVRTTTNMYAHGWDERNGGNISLLLDEAEVSEYLAMQPIRTLENISRTCSTRRKSTSALYA